MSVARARTRGVLRARSVQARSSGVRVGSAGSVSPGVQVAEVQRARMLAGAARAVDELGYAHASVVEITTRSRVSRRTFYELFSNYEDCVAAILQSSVDRIRDQLEDPALSGLAWRERIRTGLWAILCFLDREPVLARVCLVQSARGGQSILELRERILAELARAVGEGRQDGNLDCPALTGEGVVGAVLAILHTRLVRGGSESLTGLQGDLMGMIVLPYLGRTVASAERKRKTPIPIATNTTVGEGSTNTGAGTEAGGPGGSVLDGDPLAGIPMRLTYRTMRVLEVVAEHAGISNREVGDGAGMTDQGQTSKLLARLERFGLLENTGEGHAKGEANAWRLTHKGQQIAQAISAHTRDHRDKGMVG